MPEYTLSIAHLVTPDLDLRVSSVLRALGYRGPLRQTMRRSNMSKVLNRPEARGFIERRNEASNKRSVRIHLTEMGARVSRLLYAGG